MPCYTIAAMIHKRNSVKRTWQARERMIVQIEAIIHNLKRIGENNWVSLRKSICSFQRHSAKIAEKEHTSDPNWTSLHRRPTCRWIVCWIFGALQNANLWSSLDLRSRPPREMQETYCLIQGQYRSKNVHKCILEHACFALFRLASLHLEGETFALGACLWMSLSRS